ncbi:MAG: hypothetical protein ACO1N7_11220 [Sphingobacteriaceae bacterium]
MNENWQQEAPTLAAVERTNPFSVPDNYFEEMQEQIQSRITIDQFDGEHEFFNIPVNYFDSLTEKIISENATKQLKTEGSEVFSVPDNYFNELEKSILSNAGGQNHKEQIVRRIATSWLTYAAAACITAIVSFGIYFNTQNSTVEHQIAELPSEDIVEYLQLYSDAGDAPLIIKGLNNETELSDFQLELSEQEIKQYLESNL